MAESLPATQAVVRPTAILWNTTDNCPPCQAPRQLQTPCRRDRGVSAGVAGRRGGCIIAAAGDRTGWSRRILMRCRRPAAPGMPTAALMAARLSIPAKCPHHSTQARGRRTNPAIGFNFCPERNLTVAHTPASAGAPLAACPPGRWRIMLLQALEHMPSGESKLHHCNGDEVKAPARSHVEALLRPESAARATPPPRRLRGPVESPLFFCARPGFVVVQRLCRTNLSGSFRSLCVLLLCLPLCPSVSLCQNGSVIAAKGRAVRDGDRMSCELPPSTRTNEVQSCRSSVT